MNIHLTTSMRGGVNYHRMVTPHVNLLKKYPEFQITTSVDDRSWIKLDLSKINILVFTRMISLEGLEYKGVNYSLEEIVKKYKKLGIKFVVDVDDYWILDRTHPSYKIYGKEYQKQVRLSLRLADLVITTNKRLADKIRPINKNIEIIPNCIYKIHKQWDYSPLPKKTKFGYLGATSHKDDVNLMGVDWSNYDATAFVKMYKQNGFKIKPAKDVYEYGNLYNNISVSLAPIVSSQFNSCKSNLKVIEAAAKGRMIICSDEHPYKHFESVLYATDWQSQVDLLKDFTPDAMRIVAKRLSDEVNDQYNLDTWTDYRAKIYKSL